MGKGKGKGGGEGGETYVVYQLINLVAQLVFLLGDGVPFVVEDGGESGVDAIGRCFTDVGDEVPEVVWGLEFDFSLDGVVHFYFILFLSEK